MTEAVQDQEKDLSWEVFCRKRAAMWEPHIKAGILTVKLREKKRHTFPLVRVIHPICGELLIHANSNCDAINKAAEIWDVDIMTIINTARVLRYEENGKEVSR